MTDLRATRDKGSVNRQDRRLYRAFAALALVFACLPALALEPANIDLGPLKIEPTLLAEGQYVDNIYRTERDEIDSWVFYIQPRIDAWLENGPSKYALRYELQDWRYTDTPSGEDDDFTGHLFRGDIHQRFNVRNALDLWAEHHIAHEERGTGLTEGGRLTRLNDEPIEYDKTRYGGKYVYGTETGRGRLEGSAERIETDYQNFEDYTRYYDYDENRYQGVFYWGVANRISLVLDASYLETEYVEDRVDFPSLDADEIRLLAGVTWEATGKTRGTVKIGGYEREFDDNRRDKADGFSWDININYRPKTHSIIDFGARQRSYETNGLGDFIDTNEFTFDWLHMYSRGYRSKLNVLLAADDYAGIDREDVRLNIEFAVRKAVQRWVDLGIGWRYEDRDSDADLFTYQRNGFFADIKMSL